MVPSPLPLAVAGVLCALAGESVAEPACVVPGANGAKYVGCGNAATAEAAVRAAASEVLEALVADVKPRLRPIGLQAESDPNEAATNRAFEAGMQELVVEMTSLVHVSPARAIASGFEAGAWIPAEAIEAACTALERPLLEALARVSESLREEGQAMAATCEAEKVLGELAKRGARCHAMTGTLRAPELATRVSAQLRERRAQLAASRRIVVNRADDRVSAEVAGQLVGVLRRSGVGDVRGSDVDECQAGEVAVRLSVELSCKESTVARLVACRASYAATFGQCGRERSEAIRTAEITGSGATPAKAEALALAKANGAPLEAFGRALAAELVRLTTGRCDE